MASLCVLTPPVHSALPVCNLDLSSFATPDDEHRPTFEHAATPSLLDEVNRLGFDLIMAGEDPNPPLGLPFPALVAFYDGVYAAWVRQARAEREHEADFESWLDSLPDPEPDWDSMYANFDPHHEIERAEAGAGRAAQA